MKKLVLTLLTILTCGAAYALPVGNPCDASLIYDGVIWEGTCPQFCDSNLSWCDAFSFRLGFYGDYVYNRHLGVDTNENDATIEHTEIYTNAALLVGNFWDRLDIFVTLGATNFYIDTDATAFGLPTGRFIVESETDFSWSIGARATVWECGCFCFGVEGQYFYTRTDVRRVTFQDAQSVYNDNLMDAKYHEWQFGAGVSTSIPFFCGSSLHPYLAVKYASAHLNFDNALVPVIIDEDTVFGSLFNTDDEKAWGYAIGVTLVDCSKASVTAEARFGDEKALHINGQIRF